MKTTIKLTIIVLALLWGDGAFAQTWVYAYVQTPSNAGYDQYWSAKYGLENFLKEDDNWKHYSDDTRTFIYYNASGDAYLCINLIADSLWISESLRHRKLLAGQRPGDLDALYVFIGHNALLDVEHIEKLYPPFHDNMVFGCFSSNWGTDAIVDANYFLAPEGYAVLPAINLWIKGYDEKTIRSVVAIEYSTYQKNINLVESRQIFNVQ